MIDPQSLASYSRREDDGMIVLNLSKKTFDQLRKVVAYATIKAPIGSEILSICSQIYVVLDDTERSQSKLQAYGEGHMKPKERLMNMDLTEGDIETIERALAYCAVNAGNGEFAGRTDELYHRWRGDTRPGEEFEMPGDVGNHEPVDFAFPDNAMTITSTDVFVKPESKKVSCAICDAEFLLDPFGAVNEGTNISFILGSLKSEIYYLCAKCWLWIPEVAVKALRELMADKLWLENNPPTGCDLSIQGGLDSRIRDRAHLEASTERLWGGGSGGETPIPSSDSWECKPGGDLSTQGGQGGNDVSKGAMVVSRDGDLSGSNDYMVITGGNGSAVDERWAGSKEGTGAGGE